MSNDAESRKAILDKLASDRGYRIAKVYYEVGSSESFAALEKAYREDKPRAARLAMVLLAQAQLIAGLPLDDPAAYTELVCGLF